MATMISKIFRDHGFKETNVGDKYIKWETSSPDGTRNWKALFNKDTYDVSVEYMDLVRGLSGKTTNPMDGFGGALDEACDTMARNGFDEDIERRTAAVRDGIDAMARMPWEVVSRTDY